MTFENLQSFLVLAEELNFRRAASRLFISEQSLSNAIQKMERELNVTLLERKPRTVLTPAGESFLKHSKEILRLKKQLHSELADITEHAEGNLRVGMNQMIGNIFFPDIWQLFHEEFPYIRISAIEDSTINLDRRLRNNEMDLYIGINAPRGNDVKNITLAKEVMCCVYSDAFLEKATPFQQEILRNSEESFDLANLKHLPLITFSQINGVRQQLESFFISNDVRPRIVLESDKHSILYRICRQGDAVSIMYQMMLYDNIENTDVHHNLHIVPLKNKFPPRHTGLVYRKESYIPRYTIGFIECVRKIFSEYENFVNQSHLFKSRRS